MWLRWRNVMRNLHMIPWELATLAELLDIYIYVYEPECESPDVLLKEIKERIAALPDNIYTINNPRGAGRHSIVNANHRERVVELKSEGKSMRQIAFETNLSVGTVHKLIHEHRLISSNSDNA